MTEQTKQHKQTQQRIASMLAITALAFGTLSTTFSTQAAELPGKGVSVQPIQSSIAEETFQTQLVSKAL
ncbi:MAG: proline/glycine betaine ABC transporter substrate-binding protein ProX, partial [Hafnia sp.]